MALIHTPANSAPRPYSLIVMLFPPDLALMTLWHLALFPAAWYLVTAIQPLRRWMRGRLGP